MTGEIARLLALSEATVLATVLVFLRVGAVMALVPAFGERTVPVRVRLALAVAFTAIVAPLVLAGLPGEAVRSSLVVMGGAEIVAGLLLGILLRLFIVALQVAGTIAANVTSLSQLLGGATVDPQPAIAQVLVVAGLALAAMLGLHVKVAEALVQSYQVLPFGRLPLGSDVAEWGVSRIADSFAIAFMLAAPFTIAALVYNLALGAINRAMPQLMVAFVGAPAITGGALALLVLSAPLMLSVWVAAFDAALARPLGSP